MNTSPNNTPEPAGGSLSPEALAKADDPGYSSATTRPLYWSARRELWENRSIYIAPLIVAAVVLFGFLVSTIGMPERRQGVLLLDPAHQRAAIGMPYDVAAMMLIFNAFIVGVFYCLDELHGERRDRSILFWKSLPVSDLTTVFSKFAIPLIILPLLSFAIAVVTQFVMLLLSSGLSAGTLGARMSFFHLSLMLLYHILTVHGLWYAPLYGWLLLVSAWAPRAPFIWAFLPPFVIWGVEKTAFRTSHFLGMLQYRLTGPEPYTTTARSGNLMEMMSALTPVQFFSA